MLGIILLCAIGALLYRNYAELAHEYDKQRVGFGILGVGIFIGSYFIVAFVLGIIMAISGIIYDGSIGMAILFEIIVTCSGAGISWIVFLLMKKSWSAKRAAESNTLLDEKL